MWVFFLHFTDTVWLYVPLTYKHTCIHDLPVIMMLGSAAPTPPLSPDSPTAPSTTLLLDPRNGKNGLLSIWTDVIVYKNLQN